MEKSPSPTTSSTPDKPATPSAEQPHNGIATDMGEATVDSVQHATRDPRFGPGVRKAFFSTELGTRTPRRLDRALVPAVARSTCDAVAVIEAANYWQVKYKSQCLCIFPNQGWIVEDLWDDTDIHIEGRGFCEQMLTFIARDTWYAADRFAKDWARAHFQQVDFTGIHIGNVYDLKDPLSALDQIFIFGELTSFPRPFLWHVAFILITDWNNARLANPPAFNAYQDQYLPVVAHQSNDEVKGSSIKVSTSSGKKAAFSSENKARTDSVALPGLDQSKFPSPPHRIISHASQPANDLQAHTRYMGVERMARSSTASPSTCAQGLKVHKGSRNLGSPPHGRPQGWIENGSRTVSGPYLGQSPFPVPGMQQSQYGSPPIAVGPHMNVPMISSSVVGSYFVGPPVLTHPVYPAQPMDPGVMPRGHMNYQTGATRGSHMPPAYVNQPKEPHPFSMGDATNMHFPGFMRSQAVDPLAPMPRRLSQQSAGQLFDPYSGTSRKFSGGQGHSDMGKKGGTGNFTVPQNRGRRSSTSSGCRPYGNYYYMPSTGPRLVESSNRWRSLEDNTSITGDSVYGCGHTWIGPKNTTVKELWIGDLPPDVHDSELIQLFEKTVGITPLGICVKGNTVKGHVHAFATFASCADARTALTINQLNPRLRNGEVRPAISVPKRFYQKESPPAAFSEYSRVVHPANGHVRGAANAPLDDKSTAASADTETATTNGNVLYSPQDARSGLLKKPPTVQSEANNPTEDTKLTEAINLTEAKDSELEKPKREDKSPAKKTKRKNKRDSPIKRECYADDTPNPTEKLEVGVLLAVAVKDIKSSRADDTNVQDAHSTEVHIESKTNAAQDMCHATDKKQEATGQPLEQTAQLESPRNKDNVARSESPPTQIEAIAENKPFQAAQHDETTTSPAEAGEEAEDDISDDGAKNDTSFHSAPEVQSEATQIESEPEAREQATAVNHGTVVPNSEILHDSLLQDSPKLPAPAGWSNFDTSREPHSDSEQPTSAPSNTEGKSEASGPEESGGQDKVIAADTAHTEASSVKQGTEMSAPIKGASTDAVKKCGVQQVQSLHPFATKNKAQAKKEKENKRKQQRKEEADRIAKAKAEKADKVASSKKGKSGTDPKPKIEMPKIPATSSVAIDVHSGLEAATTSTEKHALKETKKSQGKFKAKATSAQEEDKQISGSEKEKIDKLSADASTVTTSTPQKADKVEAVKIPTVVQDSSARIETHPESSLSTPSSLAVPTPSTAQADNTQPSTMTPRQSLSRHSSISTIAGDMGGPTDTSSALPNNPETAGPRQDTCTGAAVAPSDNIPAETPKKKKNKRKNKKKKVSATEPSTTMEPNANGPAPARAPRSVVVDTHNYYPFTSQMSHIDAIRYNIEHDTTSYFAVTNAMRENERLEREAQEREITDTMPQPGDDEQGSSSS